MNRRKNNTHCLDKFVIGNYDAFKKKLEHKLNKGEKLSFFEENFIISSGMINEILEKVFYEIQEQEDNNLLENSNNVNINNYSSNNLSYRISDISQIIDNKNNLNSPPENVKRNKYNEAKNQKDGWFFKYDDNYLEVLRQNIKNKSPIKKIKNIPEKKKVTKIKSVKNIPNIAFDYLIPHDLNPLGLLNVEEKTNNSSKNTNTTNNIFSDLNNHHQKHLIDSGNKKLIKKFYKSQTINPLDYPQIEGKLVLKNWKFLNEKKQIINEYKKNRKLEKSHYSEESLFDRSNDSINNIDHLNLHNLNLHVDPYLMSDGDLPSIKDIKTKNLVKRVYMLKNSCTLKKIMRKIRENWLMHFDNQNIDETLKLKLFDIQSNKEGLKNKLEEKVKENIIHLLNEDLNCDKNNKLSNKLIKLYREDKYNLKIEDFNERAEKIIPKHTYLGAKAKILQENKDYLISVYFDIYDEILNDIFDSKNSIFEFNENIKGKSILKNFEMRKKGRQEIFYNSSCKDEIFNQIQTLRSTLSPKKNFKRILSNENSNDLSNNSIFSNDNKLNKAVKNYNCNCNDDEDTRSNYDRLGLVNQTYINNILLRDFSYKENIQYAVDSSKSDSLSHDTIDNTTSQLNDSLSNPVTPRININLADKNLSRQSLKLKYRGSTNNSNSNLLRVFREPLKKINLKIPHKNSVLQNSSNLLEKGSIVGNIGESSNVNNNFRENGILENNESDDVKELKNSSGRKNNSIEEYTENENEINNISSLPIKKKKHRESKKLRLSKFNTSSKDKLENIHFLDFCN